MLTVLNIDDSKIDFRLTKSQMITVAGDVDLIWAESGAKALETIESRQVDCILCDYQMPDVNGIEFLLSLRERQIDIPFIFFTGQGNEMVAAEALRNGADDYFTKDIEFAQYQRIVNSIRRVVNTKGERNKQVALELEARRFKQILDQANHGNVILNVEEEVIYANNMFASMHGEKLEELVGRPMIDFVSDRSRDQYQVLKGLIFKQGSTPPMKMWHKRGDDGSEFPAIGSAILFRSEGGEPENIVFTFMGISHKNQAMKFMEENQQNFRRLIEEGPIAYQSLDNQGRFVSVNGKWLELFGYSKEEVLGKHFEEFLTGEEIASFTEHFKSMATQGEVHNSTYKIVDFQGQARKMDIFGRISFNEKGEFIQTNCILIKAESD